MTNWGIGRPPLSLAFTATRFLATIPTWRKPHHEIGTTMAKKKEKSVDRLECGVVLCGTEVKSLRAGFANLEDAYGTIDDGEVWLLGCEIPEYEMGNRLNHKPKRPRKLLLHRREIARFAGKATQHGFTLVPLKVYFKDGRAKAELAVARGNEMHDNGEAQKKHEAP